MTDADMLHRLQQAEQECPWPERSLLVDYVVQQIGPSDDDHAEHLRAQAERVLIERETMWGAG